MARQSMYSRGNRQRQTGRDRIAARLHGICLDLVAAIQGIEDANARARYASLLFYRLMFLYFVQRMDLFSRDRCYLQHRLQQLQGQQEGGTGFYRAVLRPLFTAKEPFDHFPCFITKLFSSHEIELGYPDLSIADEVFARIFALFDSYNWPCDAQQADQQERAIIPEMLGALFEQEMHPREIGAYYTPGEITGYIARDTLLPALFTRVRARCSRACAPDALLWQTLTSQPERYIFAAARKGHEHALPEEIAAGMRDIARRERWQQLAPEQFALPGETWRDVIARRERVKEILVHFQQASPCNLDRMVTWNLDQQKLALETLRHCQQPAFLEAWYQSLRHLTVLDPTCGSGAFLRAVIPLLEELYTACLERMEAMCSPPATARSIATRYRRLFRDHLEEAGARAQRRFTILRWIIEQNLYGVDLREEAVEICRLYFCLKLLATLPGGECARLPDKAGQHIRVGNSLAGSLAGNPDAHSPPVGEQTFSWRAAFPESMERGGFDVVIGNPPYVEYEQIRQLYTLDGYATMETGNLYALTMERGTELLAPGGRFGMIVPSSATCTDGYRSLQHLLLAQQELHVASFSDQRGHLFALPHPRLCIILYEKAGPGSPQPGQVFSTPYIKLGPGPRKSLFEHLRYTEVTRHARPGLIPRYGSPLELTIADKLARQAHNLGDFLQAGGAYPVYFTRKLSWFVQVTPFIPRILDEQGCTRDPSELKILRFAAPLHARIAFAALNSSLFYWLITTGSDCRNLNMREVKGLPLDLTSISPSLQKALCQVSIELEEDLRRRSRMKPMTFRNQGILTIQCMYPARSKPQLDQIDCLLARYYGFSTEELDFLLHYDEKYRYST